MHITKSFKYSIEIYYSVKQTVKSIYKEFISTTLTPKFNNISGIFNLNFLFILTTRVTILK